MSSGLMKGPIEASPGCLAIAVSRALLSCCPAKVAQPSATETSNGFAATDQIMIWAHDFKAAASGAGDILECSGAANLSTAQISPPAVSSKAALCKQLFLWEMESSLVGNTIYFPAKPKALHLINGSCSRKERIHMTYWSCCTDGRCPHSLWQLVNKTTRSQKAHQTFLSQLKEIPWNWMNQRDAAASWEKERLCRSFLLL